MYAKRIQLVNYGPIDHLDITFPFEGASPKPVLIVGENGSGKSILLSHIVNGLVEAKTVAYPESPEVEAGKVYKIRSGSYIKSGAEHYFGRVDFEDGLFLVEMRSKRQKQKYDESPLGIDAPDLLDAWNGMIPEENDYIDSSISLDNKSRIEAIFGRSCVLYFPHNRFEEPAWLNEDNLRAQAQYMDLKRTKGYTGRRLIVHSPLHDNQNWLFDLLYDRAVFELDARNMNVPVANSNAPIALPVLLGYFGDAARAYDTVLQLVRIITRRRDARFGIGRRRNRVVSLTSDRTGQIVPNIFQLSSGETSLLNLFLSILRDFDLCGSVFSQANDIHGIALVDEIDLHLHAVHQHEVLPRLIKLFPNVQFVVTTHSPLFVLGMQKAVGDDGFALYRLPQGHRISAEEFSEFGSAYRAFTATIKFSNDIRAAIDEAQKPMVFVEGSTDRRYLQRASQLLSKESLHRQIDIRDAGGQGNLDNIWKLRNLPSSIVKQRVMLIYDCERTIPVEDAGSFLRRVVPKQNEHPIEKGIENLFSKETLEKAREHKSAFIDVDPGRTKVVRGHPVAVSDVWTINDDEKSNLCNWLCENGTEEDFHRFQVIFDLLEDLLNPHCNTAGGSVVSKDSDSMDLSEGNGDPKVEDPV